MHLRKFDSKQALVAYAQQNGLTCLLEGFDKWQQQLSPEQYELVEFQTHTGQKHGMLLSKATLKAAWNADPLRKALVPKREGPRKT